MYLRVFSLSFLTAIVFLSSGISSVLPDAQSLHFVQRLICVLATVNEFSFLLPYINYILLFSRPIFPIFPDGYFILFFRSPIWFVSFMPYLLQSIHTPNLSLFSVVIFSSVTLCSSFLPHTYLLLSSFLPGSYLHPFYDVILIFLSSVLLISSFLP